MVGVDAVLAGQLGDRLLAFDGLEGDRRFECGFVLFLSHTGHNAIPPC